ncbi:ATPase [Mesotoga sp. H07pep.5.4]|uniref:heavy metal translocating P-type ATPase n=4 Tax=unclassified Mesotoga TaxID=1184398 RepID=UPI000EF15A74|nr:heavy metal translocating P-type ATPase [Mesotoga sp. H07pep.5.4]RLL84970.1 ATPase [Mesotoga sp. H07pep.5.4]
MSFENNHVKEEYIVEGMTCAACVRAVEKAVSKIEGVERPVVNLATERLTFEVFQEVDKGRVFEAVERAGYSLKEIPVFRKAVMEIDGMTCAACSTAVEKAIGRLHGVENVSVNLSSDTVSFKYDPNILKIGEVKKVVEKAGYRPGNLVTEAFEESRLKKEAAIASYKRKFIFSAAFALPLLIIAMGHMMGLSLPAIIDPHLNPLNFAIVQLILTIPIVVAGRDFYSKGIPNLFRGSPNMDTLVGLGTGAAFSYGIFATVQIALGRHSYVGDLYFESAGVIIALISLGKYLENLSRGRTSDAIMKLMNLSPETALVKRQDVFEEVAIEEIEVGDVLLVKPGMRIPVDGEVLNGASSVDQSMITGESIPVDISESSKVIGGTTNINGAFEMRATVVGSDTVLSRIIKLVEDAQSSKAPIARMADVVSGYFVPFVLVIAAVTFLVWMTLGYGLVFSMSMMIAVLVIACPCALGLATPTAIMVGTGRGAEMGILFRNGEALETTHKIGAVVFDKTGTITEGRPRLVDVHTFGKHGREGVMQISASIASKSSHPLDVAISGAYSGPLLEVSSFEAYSGKGILARVSGQEVKMGNHRFISLMPEEMKFVDELSSEGKTPVVVSIEGRAAAVLGIADVVREDSLDAIKSLKKMGIDTYMMTGDNSRTAMAIANQVGIENVISEVMPEDKAKKVSDLKREGKTVMMVGDGINDSPALAEAHIGIAVGSGTDIAIETADVVLMSDNLSNIFKAIKLSKETIKNIKQNLFWAFFYNVIGIPLAAGLFYGVAGIRLNPMVAGAAMAFSSVSVVTNALRLKKIKI